MALIGTLRTKMTKFVVGFIALSLAAFIVGSDLLTPGGQWSLVGNDTTVGEIAGSTISLEEFQAAIQERENNYILNFGRQPGEGEMVTLRQQAWDMLVARKAIQPQYQKLGLTVSTEEVWDIIQGKNVDENIKSSFLDSAGNFDRPRLIQYLQSIESMPPSSEARIRWDIFKRDLAPGRERLKFENLLVKSNYVTTAEAEREYHAQNDVAEVKYLFVPFFAIKDSLPVTESDLKAHYQKNKHKYKTDERRSISYVTFPVIATAADTAAVREEFEKTLNDFRAASDDSTFASLHTDGDSPYTRYTLANLPAYLEPDARILGPGYLKGPFVDGNAFKAVKVVKVGADTTFSARASHILIRRDNDTDAGKKAAKEKAQKILSEIKAGADFAAKAREFGTDGTSARGGDLGWFQSGQMVMPFERAVFSATRPGLLNDVVETEFGYHIVSVTNTKDNRYFMVATIEREIGPSDETRNEAYRRADEFVTDLSGVKNFTGRAEEKNLPVASAANLTTNDRSVNNLAQARPLVTWAFRDAKTGSVSEVFDLDDTYVVAVVTDKREKGYKSLDEVKAEITPLIQNQKKGEQIISRLTGKSEPLEELAKLFGTDASVNSSSDLKLSGSNLPGVGFDPVAIGRAFGLDKGKRGKPFAGENGVVLVENVNKTEAPAINAYAIFGNQLKQALDNRGGFQISEALKEAAKIEDRRYRFF
jgi:peptidyl-prolyl cis-trans isomerase D